MVIQRGEAGEVLTTHRALVSCRHLSGLLRVHKVREEVLLLGSGGRTILFILQNTQPDSHQSQGERLILACIKKVKKQFLRCGKNDVLIIREITHLSHFGLDFEVMGLDLDSDGLSQYVLVSTVAGEIFTKLG